MSASRMPTIRPRRASATARLTVTDDLPTPPLPEAMASTRVGGGDRRLGGVLPRLPAGPGHHRRPFLGVHGGHCDLDASAPSPATARGPRTSRSIWLRSGQAAMVSATSTVTSSPLDRDAAHHAQVDDVVAELGVDRRPAGVGAPRPRGRGAAPEPPGGDRGAAGPGVMEAEFYLRVGDFRPCPAAGAAAPDGAGNMVGVRGSTGASGRVARAHGTATRRIQ